VGCGGEREPPRPASANPDAAARLPADGKIKGLKLDSPPKKYLGEDLAKWIKEGSDVYQAYGFDHLATARYTNTLSEVDPQDAYVHVEVFRMRDATAAYGAYSYDSHRHKIEADSPITHLVLGGGIAQIAAYDARLVKGDCYVKIETGDDSATGSKMMHQVVKHVAKKIVGEGRRPKVLYRLLSAEEVTDRVRLFTDKATLDMIRPTGGEDIFAMVEGAVGAVADTLDGAYVFAVLYPDDASARKGWRTYRTFLESKGATEQDGIVSVRLADETSSAAFRKGRCVAGVWGASDTNRALELTEKARKQLGGR